MQGHTRKRGKVGGYVEMREVVKNTRERDKRRSAVSS